MGFRCLPASARPVCPLSRVCSVCSLRDLFFFLKARGLILDKGGATGTRVGWRPAGQPPTCATQAPHTRAASAYTAPREHPTHPIQAGRAASMHRLTARAADRCLDNRTKPPTSPGKDTHTRGSRAGPTPSRLDEHARARLRSLLAPSRTPYAYLPSCATPPHMGPPHILV